MGTAGVGEQSEPFTLESSDGAVVTFEATLDAETVDALERFVATVAERSAAGGGDGRILCCRRGAESSLRLVTSTERLAYEICESVQEVFGGRLHVTSRPHGHRPHLAMAIGVDG
jgi:hypothetical protein